MREQLNYKHLHYFWMVARSGGVGKAGEQLNVTPQAISTQIRPGRHPVAPRRPQA